MVMSCMGKQERLDASALAAMTGILANGVHRTVTESDLAQLAYNHAEALEAERDRRYGETIRAKRERLANARREGRMILRECCR